MSLEDELLALAGDSDDDEESSVQSPASPPPPRQQQPAQPAPTASASSPKKRSRAPTKRSRKRQRRGDDDDDDDDAGVEDEDSDTLSDEDSFAASSDNGRDAPMEIATESGSEDEGDAKPSLYPLEGKYKDHADKERLLAMTEVDRETVLANRIAHIEREQQNRHLQNLLKSRHAADRAKDAAAAAASTRKSLRTKSAPKKSEEATKRGKLDELRRTKEERRARDERKATGRRSSFGDEDASKRMLSDGEEEPPEEVYAKEERPIELDDINKCRIGRTALGKLLDYPGFGEVVTDVFVRLTMFDKESNKNVYRVAQIKGFRPGKVYSMLDGARKTDQYLRLIHGKAERDFQMDMMSDSRFTEMEFSRYKKQMELDKVPLPTLSHVRAKAQALGNLATRPLSADELEVIIARRNAGKKDYILNITKRRTLEDEREKAVFDGDEARILEVDRLLQDLEDQHAAPARAETQMQRMARINAENRRRNQAEVRRAEISEKRAHREALFRAEADGGSFANPFMRVKTAVKFRHQMEGEKKDVKVGVSPPSKEKSVEVEKGVGVINGAVPVKGRRVGGVDDVIASMDLGIEIDI